MTDYQSLDSLWVCLVFSLVLVAVRIGLRVARHQKFTQGDYWCLAAAFFTFLRLIGNHLLLMYGSTRTVKDSRRILLHTESSLADEARKIVIGSKLILATRTLLILALWSLKMAVLDLLRRLILKISYERKLLYAFWTVLGLTFIGSIISVYVECRPLRLHWQIYPNPGNCVIGNDWLLTYETSNIVTDIMLMAVPFSLILSARIPATQRLRILPLFSIGIFLVTISILRTVQGKGSRIQSAQTLWASVELLFATVVAVIPTIFALARNKYESSTDGLSRMETMKNSFRSNTAGGDTVIEIDKYNTRVWTELPDSRAKSNPQDMESGIRVETRYEMEEQSTASSSITK